jgi:hypothetical protein
MIGHFERLPSYFSGKDFEYVQCSFTYLAFIWTHQMCKFIAKSEWIIRNFQNTFTPTSREEWFEVFGNNIVCLFVCYRAMIGSGLDSVSILLKSSFNSSKAFSFVIVSFFESFLKTTWYSVLRDCVYKRRRYKSATLSECAFCDVVISCKYWGKSKYCINLCIYCPSHRTFHWNSLSMMKTHKYNRLIQYKLILLLH